MLETILFTSRDAALIYFGDEIAMSTGPIPTEPNRRRDAERAPMQWTAGKNAGFTTADTPWLPVIPNYIQVNVEVESKEPMSPLEFHKALIALRRTNAVIKNGDQISFSTGNDKVVAFTRNAEGKRIVVLTNFSGTSQDAKLGPMIGKKAKVLQSNYTLNSSEWTLGTSITLPAYAALVVAIE
jgi:alpha-glucosidase